MSAPIAPITPPSPADITGVINAKGNANGPSFSDTLSAAIQNVEDAGANADAAAKAFLSGNGGELHSTILAAQNAELEFDMLMQARNKVVSAYEEIMRMQI